MDGHAASLKVTDDKGADVIFDPVGGSLFDQATRCILWNGRILVAGFASGRVKSALCCGKSKV